MTSCRPVGLAGVCAVAAIALAAALQPGAVPARAQEAEAAHICCFRVEVSNIDRSVEFYQHLVGVRLAGVSGDDKGLKQAVFTTSGKIDHVETMLVLAHDAARTTPINPDSVGWISFRVPDVAAAVARIRAAGYKVVSEPTADQDRRRLGVIVADPDGFHVELLQLAKPAP